jgi:hypothetical protein
MTHSYLFNMKRGRQICVALNENQISITYSTEQALLTHIQEVPGFSLGRDIDYTDRSVVVFFV